LTLPDVIVGDVSFKSLQNFMERLLRGRGELNVGEPGRMLGLSGFAASIFTDCRLGLFE